MAFMGRRVHNKTLHSQTKKKLLHMTHIKKTTEQIVPNQKHFSM
jgi:hypothetical protein